MSRVAHGNEDRADRWEEPIFCWARKQEILVATIPGVVPEPFESIPCARTFQYVDEE